MGVHNQSVNHQPVMARMKPAPSTKDACHPERSHRPNRHDRNQRSIDDDLKDQKDGALQTNRIDHAAAKEIHLAETIEIPMSQY